LTHVNCQSLAAEAAVLERVYELGDLPRLRDVLADAQGKLRARFAFVMLSSGRAGAEVRVQASPHLICQRCLLGFAAAIDAGSEVEFATDEETPDAASDREFYRMENGLVSLRELAEEELLLALPIAPACDTPLTCGNAPRYATADAAGDAETPGDVRRPFSALQDLLKKT
jgi:uncharacterized metal-binding protein YceD (DUF177 family)